MYIVLFSQVKMWVVGCVKMRSWQQKDNEQLNNWEHEQQMLCHINLSPKHLNHSTVILSYMWNAICWGYVSLRILEGLKY